MQGIAQQVSIRLTDRELRNKDKIIIDRINILFIAVIRNDTAFLQTFPHVLRDVRISGFLAFDPIRPTCACMIRNNYVDHPFIA